MKTKPALKLLALCHLLSGIYFSTFAAGPTEFFDVNGATSGFGSPSPTGLYDLAGTTIATTTLTTGFASSSTVLSVVVASANNILVGETLSGTGVPAGVLVNSVSGTTIGVSAFTSTAASSGNYTFGNPLAWNASSLGTAATTAFTSSATMEFTGVTGPFAINLDAADVLGGVVVNSPNINVILVGNADAHPSGSSTWSVVANSSLTEANTFESAGGMDFNNASMALSGGGTISFLTPIGENSSGGTAAWTESMTGSGAVNLDWTNSVIFSTFAGSYTLTAGTLNFETGAACSNAFLGFSFATSQFKINGGTIDNTSSSAQTLFVNGGGFYSIGGSFIFKGSSSLTFGGANVSLAVTPTVTVLANTLTIGTSISSFGEGLTKSGIGTLALTNANTYSGSTTILAGTLALSGSGSIADSTNILIASGATFDVSGLTNAMAPGAGQTLTGEGGTGTINGNLNLSAGSPLVLTNNGTGATLTITAGTLTLKNNAVTVEVTGSALTANTYTLISPGAGGSVAGSVATSPVTVGGAGLAANTTASLQISSGGALQLVVSPNTVVAPTAVSIINNGDGTVTLGFLGSAGTKYVVQSTPDLGFPNWSNISTNTAGTDGTWMINQSMLGYPQLFFRAALAQ
jgi:autotransporter-associated beta strand protein